jgi:hypothetical protein
MPPLSNTQRAGATIALMQSMLLLLGLLYEIILQEQSHVRRVEEENRKRRREELNEHLLLVFEADRSIRRGVDGEPIPRKKRRQSRYDWALARALLRS